MNRIERLIEEYCPDGVEYKKLTEVCTISRGRVLSKQYIRENAGDYPVYSSQTVNDGVLGKINSYEYDGEYITWTTDGANAGSVFYRKGKFNITNVCGLLDINSNSLTIKFLTYWLELVAKNYVNEGMGNPKLMSHTMSEISIPIPPLPIQQEIANILDKFTQLEAELEAELEARRKQYEFYLNQLMEFEGKEVERKALGDIGEFIRGKRFVRTDMIEEGFPCIHYGEMYTHYNVYATESKSFISEELAKKLRVANHGDVVIVAAGETIEDIGKATAWLGESDVVTHDACFTFSSSLNPKFVAYFSRTKLFHDQIKKHISSGKISAINAKGLEKAKIPIPSYKEQERIVSILDKFDALVNDTTIGLQAEIVARRKQYEHYRNKLLTFAEYESL